VPIISPEKLKEDLPESIIVSCGSFSGEVALRLRREYPGIAIAIMKEDRLETVVR
jgi:hypothetical protein